MPLVSVSHVQARWLAGHALFCGAATDGSARGDNAPDALHDAYGFCGWQYEYDASLTPYVNAHQTPGTQAAPLKAGNSGSLESKTLFKTPNMAESPLRSENSTEGYHFMVTDFQPNGEESTVTIWR